MIFVEDFRARSRGGTGTPCWLLASNQLPVSFQPASLCSSINISCKTFKKIQTNNELKTDI